jgi:serine-type D-Ala-D-Ala carboxypeptidase/endopeptidase (penicillin-binding protein 4)
MQLIRITSIFGILFPLLIFISCSSIPRAQHDTENEYSHSTDRLKRSLLEIQLQNILKKEEFNHTIPSIIVLSADYGDTIFSHHSDLLVRPASNQKLITSAAALHILKPSFNFRTVLYRSGFIRNGILEGDVVLKGYGNPLLDVSDIESMIESLHLFGIRKINGDVIIDDSYFDAVFWPAGWMWDDEPFAFAPFISALSINKNVVTFSIEKQIELDTTLSIGVNPSSTYIQYELRNQHPTNHHIDEIEIVATFADGRYRYLITGNPAKARLPRTFTVTVRDPAMFAGYIFLEKLTESGIEVLGTVHRGEKDITSIPLVQLNIPIDLVLRAMNKESDNLAAEMVWKTISAELYGPPGTGDGGSRAVREVLQQLGLVSTYTRLMDGSGVSFYNLVTPRLLAELLYRMNEEPDLIKPFYESLAILGIDGTLIRRGIHSSAQGRVRAKTGTLSGISTLAGYIDTISGERLIFVMMFQNFSLPAARYRRIQDEICDILVHFNREASVLTTPLRNFSPYSD